MFENKLAEAIKLRREEMGLSQEQLAELIGKSTAFVGQLERGDSLPRFGTLEKIIQQLGIDANSLFSESLASAETNVYRVKGMMLQMSPAKQQLVVKIVADIFDSDK